MALVDEINRLTKWLNLEIIGLAISLATWIAGAVIWFMNWRVGHETAEEKIRMDIGVNIWIISFIIAIMIVVIIVITVKNRRNKINILSKVNPLATAKYYKKPSIATVVIASIPVCAIVITLLILLMSTIR